MVGDELCPYLPIIFVPVHIYQQHVWQQIAVYQKEAPKSFAIVTQFPGNQYKPTNDEFNFKFGLNDCEKILGQIRNANAKLKTQDRQLHEKRNQFLAEVLIDKLYYLM